MSKEIVLTQGKVALVDDGDFEWLNQWKWHYHNLGYARRSWKENGKTKGVYMHRLINDTDIIYQTDHINRDKLDNRRSNLRTVTASVNQTNRWFKNNTTGVKNITFDHEPARHRKPWKVAFNINKKTVNVGRFATIDEAKSALEGAYHG